MFALLPLFLALRIYAIRVAACVVAWAALALSVVPAAHALTTMSVVSGELRVVADGQAQVVYPMSRGGDTWAIAVSIGWSEPDDVSVGSGCTVVVDPDEVQCADVESMRFDLGGGDDYVETIEAADVGVPVVIDAGAGDDWLDGVSGRVFAGPGDDVVEPYADTVSEIDCGAGTADFANADAAVVPTVNCEHLPTIASLGSWQGDPSVGSTLTSQWSFRQLGWRMPAGEWALHRCPPSFDLEHDAPWVTCDPIDYDWSAGSGGVSHVVAARDLGHVLLFCSEFYDLVGGEQCALSPVIQSARPVDSPVAPIPAPATQPTPPRVAKKPAPSATDPQAALTVRNARIQRESRGGALLLTARVHATRVKVSQHATRKGKALKTVIVKVRKQTLRTRFKPVKRARHIKIVALGGSPVWLRVR